MATKDELNEHLEDCSGWRIQIGKKVDDGFANMGKRLDAQDEMLKWVNETRTVGQGVKRIAMGVGGFIGYAAAFFEILRGLGLIHALH